MATQPLDIARALGLAQRASQLPGRGFDEELRALLTSATASSFAPLDWLARRWSVDVDVVRYGRVAHGPLLVLSMSRSGWTRLEAVERIGAGFDRLSLIALLLRLDDVVVAVRARAAPLLEAAIARAAPATLAAVLPVVDVLTERDRARRSPLLPALRAQVRSTATFDGAAWPLDVERSLRRLWGLSDDVGQARLVAIALQALRDGDVELALSMTRQHAARLGGDEALTTALARHRAGRARVRAAQLVGAGRDPAALPLLLALSVDVRAEVRAAARRALGPAIEEQRDHARAVVDAADVAGASRAVVGGLGSLAEIGRPGDLGRISRFLHDERARVQAEAVRALVGSHASADLVSVLDVLLDKLLSPSWRVGVEAARGLPSVPAERLPLDELRRIEPQAHDNVRRLLGPLLAPGRWGC